MDSYRDFPSEFDASAEVEPAQESSVAGIGSDERRMHVRAYNYWVSLLDGRDYPSVEDLDPAKLVEFAPHSLLLDFTGDRANPSTPYIGEAIRTECGIDDEVATIADVPSRSLLSRLTDHYLQIIANRAPVGFEAEFVNQRGDTLCYRGILMPFSSDGETIDFIYGVINWKVGQSSVDAATAAAELRKLDAADEAIVLPAADEDDLPEIGVNADAALADRLWAARESAQAARAAEGRSRDALYQALARAYDFAVASKQAPQDYAELLEESGVKAQARSPMTPVVKLVFGIDYDKARLTEYAAALAFAERQKVEAGTFLDFIQGQAGGLKALVAAERAARRPDAGADRKMEMARERLRCASAVSIGDIASEDEFALVLTRRSSAGAHEPIAVIDDQAMVERAIRRAAA
jgi:hypothetical protein